ncbi:MAG: DUF192 domain-containing protein [Planctomycetota bacterium]
MKATVAAGLALLVLTGCEPTSPDRERPANLDDSVAGEIAADAGTQAHNRPAAVSTLPVTLGDQTFTLELALDNDTRFQGLSDRAYLAPDGGMLFVFPRPRNLEFVMRRCLVPIDIIFLDAGGRVTASHAMTVEPYDRPERQLRRYGSQYRAQFAIELAGGTLETLDLQPGDRIELPLEDLKARAK